MCSFASLVAIFRGEQTKQRCVFCSSVCVKELALHLIYIIASAEKKQNYRFIEKMIHFYQHIYSCLLKKKNETLCYQLKFIIFVGKSLLTLGLLIKSCALKEYISVMNLKKQTDKRSKRGVENTKNALENLKQ